MLLDEIKSFHFVGVGGAGMSAIAYILLKKGYRISGSDLHASEATARLSNIGATIFMGHAAANLGEVGAIVLSSAIRSDNPELVELFVKMAGKRFNTDRFKIVPLGSTVLTHSGPGTLAVFFFDEWQEAYRFE